MTKFFRLLCLLIISCGASPQSSAGDLQVLAVKGTIVDSSQHSLPGCLVSVVSEFGRSAPVFSDADGKFSVELSLPSDKPDAANQEPFLEIYWNRKLTFRQPMSALAVASAVSGDRDAAARWPGLLRNGGSIVLQPIRLGK
jgi:hypothetical protein